MFAFRADLHDKSVHPLLSERFPAENPRNKHDNREKRIEERRSKGKNK